MSKSKLTSGFSLNKMSKAKLKQHLLTLTKEQVVDIMLELYGSSKEANAWLDLYLEPNIDGELENYKKAIRSQFYGRNECQKNPSFRECNKLITAFKKLVRTRLQLPT